MIYFIFDVRTGWIETLWLTVTTSMLSHLRVQVVLVFHCCFIKLVTSLSVIYKCRLLLITDIMTFTPHDDVKSTFCKNEENTRTLVVCLIHMFWASYESCQRKLTGKVWLLSIFELSIMSKENNC